MDEVWAVMEERAIQLSSFFSICCRLVYNQMAEPEKSMCARVCERVSERERERGREREV